MKTKEAIELFQFYQKSTHKQRTLQSYQPLLRSFGAQYGERPLKTFGPEEIFHFLEAATSGRTKSTRRLRYAQMKAFYNFIINRCDFDIKNPCSASLVSKAFKGTKPLLRKIPEKELIDELIYNTHSLRDRLMLELQARCGLRIGESLKIKVSDVSERRILLREPKSGKKAEVAYMPEPVSKRMADYIRDANLSPEDRLFPICYSTALSDHPEPWRQTQDEDHAARSPSLLRDLCQQKRCSAGDHLEGDPQAPGPEDDPKLSGQGQRSGDYPVDGHPPWKID